MRVKLIAAIFIATILTACASTSKQSDQNFDAKSTAIQQFATALLTGDAESAKLSSAPGKWDEIDEWLKKNPPISCKADEINTSREGYIPSELSGGSFFTFGDYDEQTGEWLINVVYECKFRNVNNCFELRGARVEKANNEEWKVLGWDKICEKNDVTDPCMSISMCK